MKNIILECLLTESDYKYVTTLNKLAEQSQPTNLTAILMLVFMIVVMLLVVWRLLKLDKMYNGVGQLRGMAYFFSAVTAAFFAYLIYSVIQIPQLQKQTRAYEDLLSTLDKPSVEVVEVCVNGDYEDSNTIIELVLSKDIEQSMAVQKLKYGK